MSNPRIPLMERFWSRVEKTDTCWNWTGSLICGGYGKIRQNKKPKMAHRLSYEIHVGEIPSGMHIDHICHNTGCVNPEHLRVASNKENGENRKGPITGSVSGVRGVSWHKAVKKWQAQIRHNGRNIHLGYYETIEEADAAVTAKRLELFTYNDLDRRES